MREEEHLVRLGIEKWGRICNYGDRGKRRFQVQKSRCRGRNTQTGEEQTVQLQSRGYIEGSWEKQNEEDRIGQDSK